MESSRKNDRVDAEMLARLARVDTKLVGPGEVSASGLPDEVGVLVLSVPPLSRAAQLGLRRAM